MAGRFWSLLAAIFAVTATAATAEVDVHGFVLGTVAGRTTGQKTPEAGDFVAGEERIRLEAAGMTESGDSSFLARGDLLHDGIANTFGVDLREAYAAYSRGPVELRFGRQIVTWGVGDLFFVNDVFPKDWASFFSGRPMEYLKLGVDGLRMRFSSDLLNVEALAVPFFSPDEMPSPARFVFPNPLASVRDQRETKPSLRYSNIEPALRLYRTVAGFDLSLYAYRGYWRTPSVRLDDPGSPTTATWFFPRLAVYGASAQRTFLGGVLSLETGFYDSRNDGDGRDSSVPNSQERLLAGYQRELGSGFTAGLQGYGERMKNYGAYRAGLPPGMPVEDRFRGVVSIRLTQFLHYQAWRLSVFAAYSPTDEDYFAQPEIAYRITDNLNASVGANHFGGESENTFFGRFDESDNVFLTVRYFF